MSMFDFLNSNNDSLAYSGFMTPGGAMLGSQAEFDAFDNMAFDDIGSYTPMAPSVAAGGTSFFDPNASMADNINQSFGLIGSGLSLASMLSNWGEAKKTNRLNRQALRQEMDQSQQAFDRNVARQDRTRANIEDANRRAMQTA